MISVVVATLNSAKRLPRCLQSVAAQSHPQREVVLQDGGSTDGTLEIVRAHAGLVAHWDSSRDRGVYDAWNKALAHVRGEWVCFLGADDHLWSPGALAAVARAARMRRPETRLLSGQVAVVNALGEVLEVHGRPWRRGGRASLRWLSLPYPGMFVHRTLFEEAGPFDPAYRIGGDYDFLVRALRLSEVESIPEVLTGMEVGGISSATANELAMLRDIARVWRTRGLARTPTPWWWWTYGKAAVRVGLRRAAGERTASRIFDAVRRLKGRSPFWTRR